VHLAIGNWLVTRRQQPETLIQKALVAHLKVRATPGVFWFAIPNGGVRSKVEAAIMKATGTRAGMPDMGFVHEGRPYFLEVKAEERRPTKHQLKAIDEINAAGGFACIAYGIDAAIRCLEGWGYFAGK
jgi:hypothetical protein